MLPITSVKTDPFGVSIRTTRDITNNFYADFLIMELPTREEPPENLPPATKKLINDLHNISIIELVKLQDSRITLTFWDQCKWEDIEDLVTAAIQRCTDSIGPELARMEQEKQRRRRGLRFWRT